jgi:transposase
MFVRKRANKSGTYSVLLISSERLLGKTHPVPKVIKNFGTTQNEQELDVLMQQAELYKSQLQTSYSKIKIKSKIFNVASALDVKSCISYNTGFSDIYGDIFTTVFGELDLKPALLQRLKELVVMRIAHPASKSRTAQISEKYGVIFNSDNLYYLMDKITNDLILDIKQTIYNYTVSLIASKKKKIDILFYDLTTIYFETSTQDGLRNFGFSKDGKHQHVQIMLAAIVTTDGLPIDYEEFPGNCYEGHTLIPVINKIRARYSIEKAVLVADSALMNKINLQSLDELGIKYIISARIKNTKKEIKHSILDLSSYSAVYTDTIDNDDEIKAQTIKNDTGDLIVAYHSTKRARKDLFDRQKSIEKIKKYLSSTAKSKLTGCLKKSYIKVNRNCKIAIDHEKLKNEEQYDGFFGLRTNIKKSNPAKLLSSYRGLWQIEQTFRIAKSNLEIRPVFHYAPARIKSHFIICYMALALIRYVEYKLKRHGLHIPCDQFHLMLNKIRKIRLIDFNDETFELLENSPPELTLVYKALNIKMPSKFQHISVA